MSSRPIYLDNNATTRLDPRVLEAMLPFLTESYGNAASRGHTYGWEAEKAVDRARRQVGDLIGASAREILFTSGATESNNLALKGALWAGKAPGAHVVSCRTEHKAVLDALEALGVEGYAVTLLTPDPTGRVTPEQVAAALTDRTVLVALMMANNEIGTLHPTAGIGALCKARGILFFADGAQAAGKIPIDVESMGIDLLSLSAHKMYGPKGVGALYVRRKSPTVRLEPLIHGGGQERGMRSGTLNVPGIVGMGAAAELARQVEATEPAYLASVRDRFEAGVLASLAEVTVNGCREHRLPNTSSLSFRWIEGESLMMSLKGLAVSSGSACTSASLEASHVLKAIGLDDRAAHASIRFSLGRYTLPEEIDLAIREVVSAVRRLRDLSPLYRERSAGRAAG